MRVGNIVRKTKSYWYGAFDEEDETIGELFLIIEAERTQGIWGYGIAKLDDFEDSSWWWHDKQLEFVRDGFDKEYNDYLDYVEDK